MCLCRTTDVNIPIQKSCKVNFFFYVQSIIYSILNMLLGVQSSQFYMKEDLSSYNTNRFFTESARIYLNAAHNVEYFPEDPYTARHRTLSGFRLSLQSDQSARVFQTCLTNERLNVKFFLPSSDVWRIYGSIHKIWRNLKKIKSKVVIRHLNLTGGGRLNPTDSHYVA
jgi:hypothetical protein